ncbi:MAG: DNA recombination protein RmuC [Candidatus Aminicenantes bacterium]|nr:DNA recombination protein RmuC [Candidatus Aminicenantes bacterium]TET21180.1 MAG: DNA recombination protein RmuC [Candidatus Aminicenantes bacterium]
MNINLFLILFSSALILLFIFLIWYLKNTTSKIEELKNAQKENQALSLMQQQISQLTQNINQQLQNMSGQFQKTTGHIGSTIGDVKKGLGKMEEVTREVLEKAKNISNLEDLLRAPKFRGGLGELFLGDLLGQILPPAHYDLQYKFKSGEIVDAIVRIGSNLVPIDSKFPLENFKKYLSEENSKEKEDFRKKFVSDVKKHIDEIAKKYILPDEDTYDFALMYIPAENIYYETILKDESFGEERSIFSYAIQKRVIPVSPNSFFAYLQVIVLGLKGLQIEKSAKSIFQALARLQGDLSRFKTDFQMLGTHLVNAKGRFDDAEKRLERFSDKLEIVSGDDMEQLPEPAKKEKKSS